MQTTQQDEITLPKYSPNTLQESNCYLQNAHLNDYYQQTNSFKQISPPYMVQIVEDTCKINQLQGQIDILIDEIKYLYDQIEASRNNPEVQCVEETLKIQELQEIVLQNEMENQNLKQNINDIALLYDQLEKDTNNLRENYQNSQNLIESLKSQNIKYENQKQIIEMQNQTIKEYQDQIKELTDSKVCLQLLENKHRIEKYKQGDLESTNEQINQEIASKYDKITEQNIRISFLEKSLQQLQKNFDQIQEENQQKSRTIQKKKQKLQTLKSEMNQLKKQFSDFQNQIFYLQSQNTNLLLENGHLQSHEERLAILHKELEQQKQQSLIKIKQNDQLMHQISKLELHIKKQNTKYPHFDQPIYQENINKSMSKDEQLKRSKLAIMQADNIKYSKIQNQNDLLQGDESSFRIQSLMSNNSDGLIN